MGTTAMLADVVVDVVTPVVIVCLPVVGDEVVLEDGEVVGGAVVESTSMMPIMPASSCTRTWPKRLM